MCVWLRKSMLVVALGFIVATSADAQCLEWSAGFEGADISGNGWPNAMAVFDDGSGPALFAAGGFTGAGGLPAGSVAKWNGTQWSSVGDGMNAWVRALIVFDDGSGPALYAGGHFIEADGAPAAHIAKWDGASWTPVGSGMDDDVAALAVFDDGTGPALYAGGLFELAGGNPALHVARWDGSSWQAVGGGTDANVFALTSFDDGSGAVLCAGGDFALAGGVPAISIARWDGANWSAFGSGMQQFSDVFALASYDDGSGPKLYAGGSFASAGSSNAKNIARWTGSDWTTLGGGAIPGTNLAVRGLTVFDDGTGPQLYVVGQFTQVNLTSMGHIARWNGSSWSTVGSGLNLEASAAAVFDDGSGAQLYVGGIFNTAGGISVGRIAKWSGSAWSKLSERGFDLPVRALAAFDDGAGTKLYAGGDFTSVNGVSAARIACWDGTQWSALGSGMNQPVRVLKVYDDGTGAALYAAGDFTLAGGVSANHIAKWNGRTWTALGNGVNGRVDSMLVFDEGFGSALFVGGVFNGAGSVSAEKIARWDGSDWSALGWGMNGSSVRALAAFDDGSGSALYAGGDFNSAGLSSAAGVAKWINGEWLELPVEPGGAVWTMLVFDDGNGEALFAGGFIVGGNGHIARFDGSSWSQLGSGLNAPVHCMAAFDDGSGPALYVGGEFETAGGQSARDIARWDGTSWSSLGNMNDTVLALASYDDGTGADLFAGGEFTKAGPLSSTRIARWFGCSTHLTPLCFGDGVDAAVTTACPCANFGQAGHGCGNSVNSGGALLSASGDVDPDTVDFTVSDIPPGVGSIYLQGSALASAGIVFGDGVRCAAGQLTRLGARNDTDNDGSTSFGAASGDGQVSVIGAVNAGGTYYYQTYYRNPSPSWCPPATFNVSNGMAIQW